MDSVPDTFPSLFVGYTVIWAILGAYIFMLGRKVDRLGRGGQRGAGSDQDS